MTDTTTHKTIAAGSEYKGSARHEKWWGKNHREEWATPVTVPVLKLDTAFGGLTPYRIGGGNESRSLRLRTKAGREYTLRSINKSREQVVPPDMKGTFMEDIINDGISMSHPYGAFAITGMMEAAGIYHTNPKLVYLPQQAALDSFNTRFANELYLLEEKPTGNWQEADHLGNFTNLCNTEDVMAAMERSNTVTIDQPAFIRARLFDLLIGDWDRHEGNWSWGEAKTKDGIQYKPVPRDRDQAFYYHDGKLNNFVVKVGGLSYMQHFDKKLKDVDKLGTSGRRIDRYFTNELTLEDWMKQASFLQEVLSDAVITKSVAQLPPEVYATNGQELIDKLKARRDQLPEFTKKYYEFIADQVEIVGSKQAEYYEVTSRGNDMQVAVYRIKAGKKDAAPYYTRTFKPGETKEVRLFGLDGKDVYNVNSDDNKITIRIIGGPGKDSIIQAKHKIHVYDNAYNSFQTTNARMHLSSDTSIHSWDYRWFKYDKSGFLPVLFYSNADRLYAGLRYRITNNKWRKAPYSTAHEFGVHYSISQNALSAFWEGVKINAIGKWNLGWRAEYDMIRWTNYYGNGNETKLETNDVNYYRMRSKEWYVAAGLNRSFGPGNKNTFYVNGYYQQVKMIDDTERFPSKVFSPSHEIYKTNPYAGVILTYTYIGVKDTVTPEKGITFIANANFSNNFLQKEFFQRYNARVQAWLPIVNKVSLAIRAGAETIVNDEVLSSGQLNQHAVVGGPRTMRGFRRERFWGKTAFYNANELRYITNFRTRFMTGKIGFFGFVDQGRVWMPGENSNKMHYSYGPGIIVVPFNKYNISVTYGISEEMRLVQFRLHRLLQFDR